jgi:flagellar protein FliO/FliZ
MAGKGLVTLLGGVSVGPRERVVLLQVDDARLVVGVAPGQVRTLHVMDPAASEEASFEEQLADVTSPVEKVTER